MKKIIFIFCFILTTANLVICSAIKNWYALIAWATVLVWTIIWYLSAPSTWYDWRRPNDHRR